MKKKILFILSVFFVTILFHISLSLFIILLYNLLLWIYQVNKANIPEYFEFFNNQTYFFIGFLPFSFWVFCFMVTSFFISNIKFFSKKSMWINYCRDFLIPMGLGILMGIFTYVYAYLRLKYPFLCPIFVPPFLLILGAFWYSGIMACLLYQIVLYFRIRGTDPKELK
jgi:hypothetical protein